MSLEEEGMSKPRTMVFSWRVELAKRFEAWADEYCATKCWENLIAFLQTNGMLKEDAVWRSLGDGWEA